MSEQNSNIAAEKLRIAMVKNNDMKFTKVAEMLQWSPSNLSVKFKKNNFSEAELRSIAEALGYDLEIYLVSKETGERI